VNTLSVRLENLLKRHVNEVLPWVLNGHGGYNPQTQTKPRRETPNSGMR
jgi:hypothetical protein